MVGRALQYVRLMLLVGQAGGGRLWMMLCVVQQRAEAVRVQRQCGVRIERAVRGCGGRREGAVRSRSGGTEVGNRELIRCEQM